MPPLLSQKQIITSALRCAEFWVKDAVAAIEKGDRVNALIALEEATQWLATGKTETEKGPI